MPKSARIVTAIVIAVTGIYFGLRLAVFAEKDDAPGGVIIGIAIVFGSAALALWLALRPTPNPSPNDGGTSTGAG